MIPWWLLAPVVFGANFVLWGTIGLVRLLDDSATRTRRRLSLARSAEPGAESSTVDHRRTPLAIDDVAVLIPAHNEALVIGDSLRAVAAVVPLRNVHVVSDGSTDDTLDVARKAGVRAIATRKNVGKAGALQDAISRFRLVERFRAVMLLDADTHVTPDYFAAALPLFDDPQVVAVAGCVRTTASGRGLSAIGNVLVSHRQRIYAITQRLLKFGQTWRYANATHIVPGFASLYRTEVLPHIDMNPPGLVIEDFNMTFEVYRKRLGRVGFSLSAVAVTQDPDNLRDYVRQMRRWSLGLWQTVRRHRPRFDLFTGMLVLLLCEMLVSSVMFALLPVLLVVLAVPEFVSAVLEWPPVAAVHGAVAARVGPGSLLYGVLAPDAGLTLLVAAFERRLRILCSGPFFLLLRVIDAVIALYTLPLAFLTSSSGTWRSPARRAVTAVSSSSESPADTRERSHATE